MTNGGIRFAHFFFILIVPKWRKLQITSIVGILLCFAMHMTTTLQHSMNSYKLS